MTTCAIRAMRSSTRERISMPCTLVRMATKTTYATSTIRCRIRVKSPMAARPNSPLPTIMKGVDILRYPSIHGSSIMSFTSLHKTGPCFKNSYVINFFLNLMGMCKH